MKKTELRQSIEKRYGAFLNVNEVAEYLRVDRGTARQMLNGLAYLPSGRAKLYYSEDVAERIIRKVRSV